MSCAPLPAISAFFGPTHPASAERVMFLHIFTLSRTTNAPQFTRAAKRNQKRSGMWDYDLSSLFLKQKHPRLLLIISLFRFADSVDGIDVCLEQNLSLAVSLFIFVEIL